MWLADALRTPFLPYALAELADHPNIGFIDVPRPLKREVNLTCAAINIAAFRALGNPTGRGVCVGVLDGEVSKDHAGLTGRVVLKSNFTREPWGSPDGHGTAVAGIIGSADSTYGGVAPAATIYSYKIFATSDSSLDANDAQMADAIEQAMNDGAHIINLSWGAGGVSTGTGMSRLARVCDNAWRRGVVIVKSAGNDGPAKNSLTIPADAAGIIVVGGTDRHAQSIGSYSSWGILDDGTSRPHVLAPGGTDSDGIFSCVPAGGFAACGRGTSFAAPHVSGVLALMLEANARLTADQARSELLAHCRSLTGVEAERQGSGVWSY
jgi:serine protease AprX